MNAFNNRIKKQANPRILLKSKDRKEPLCDKLQCYLHMQNQGLKGQQLLCTLGNLLQILWLLKKKDPAVLLLKIINKKFKRILK